MDHETDFYWLSVNYWRLTRLWLTMQCVAPVPCNCVSHGLRASLAPLAKCAAQFVNGSRFELQCSVLIKRAAHLTKCARIWSNVGTWESEIFVQIESRIESAATIRIDSRIESGCSRLRVHSLSHSLCFNEIRDNADCHRSYVSLY